MDRSVLARFKDTKWLEEVLRFTNTASAWLVVSLVCCKLMVSRRSMTEQSTVGHTSLRLVWLRLTCFRFTSCGIIFRRLVADWVPSSDSDKSREESLLNLGQSRNCRELVGVILSLQMEVEDQMRGSLPTL